MERLKSITLQKSFFFLSVLCLLVSLLFAAFLYTSLGNMAKRYPSGGVAIHPDGTIIALEQPTPSEEKALRLLNHLQLLTLILLPSSGLAAAGVLFYRWKLKAPIEALRTGAERIRNHDLDFSIPETSGDELGRVCAAFEAMRAELLRTNQQLWQQTEERKRLNAAFAHDLRNPVTVLKGTVQLLRRGVPDGQALDRLEYYTARIEQYIEAMSSVQRLEQLPVERKPTSSSVLRAELEETAKLLAPHLAISIYSLYEGTVAVDRSFFLTVAENLICNAARFAKSCISLRLEYQTNRLSLTISDDGPGFPPELLRDGGIKPFGRGGNEAEHFGMGLYTCQLLCTKHGGELRLENKNGANAAAIFDITPHG